MKRGRGEIKTRTSDRLRAAWITGSRKSLPTGIQNLSSSSEERTEDIMAEGSGGKRESPGTSKKRVRTETKKEEATVQKKQRIKSLVSRKRVYRGKGKKQKEVEGKRMCKPKSTSQLQFLIGGRVLRFGLREFALITGLRCHEIPDINHEDIKGGGRLKGVYFENLKTVTRQYLNVMFNINDDEVFDGYPWGRVAFELLVDFMNRAVCSKGQTGISMGGFIFPILAWAYELKVSPMLATPDEVGMPFFAPFIETEKDILKEAEDELRKNKNFDHIASVSLNRGMSSTS
ncbi:protein Ycf2-like [Cucumis melo var. makuwa]|uniref:Protein Ycf2-like n=1 Tax=Cucumis melo var. makuwa TaxID=1194695 RepID=A0A5D3BBJ1_CUCMM|nr:protein Ycf2-like [Cucumis melo var. makuwa]